MAITMQILTKNAPNDEKITAGRGEVGEESIYQLNSLVSNTIEPISGHRMASWNG